MRNERAFGHSMWLWSRPTPELAHVKGSEWYLANGLTERKGGGGTGRQGVGRHAFNSVVCDGVIREIPPSDKISHRERGI